MRVLILFLAAVCKSILCRVFFVGICLLLVWLKGFKLHFDSSRWDEFFLTLSPGAVQRYMVGIYFPAALLSSAAVYFALTLLGEPYSLAFVLLLFFGGAAVSAWRYRCGRAELFQRLEGLYRKTSAEENGDTDKHEQ